jgi:hypothetical protein
MRPRASSGHCRCWWRLGRPCTGPTRCRKCPRRDVWPCDSLRADRWHSKTEAPIRRTPTLSLCAATVDSQLDSRDVPRFRPLRALGHLIGHPVVVLEVFLLALHYTLTAHKGRLASVLRQDEAVSQVSAVPMYPSLYHISHSLPTFGSAQAPLLIAADLAYVKKKSRSPSHSPATCTHATG